HPAVDRRRRPRHQAARPRAGVRSVLHDEGTRHRHRPRARGVPAPRGNGRRLDRGRRRPKRAWRRVPRRDTQRDVSSILVVDDERGIRALCSDVLGRAGHEIEAVDTAARDYIGKPFSPDELRLVVQRALAEDELKRKHGELTKRLAYGSMIGESPAMQQMRATIDKVAQSDATVLITGDSGTGKELVARALHFAGRRASGPFVPVNCGALVGTLLDSELFGHVRGAFTGADTSKRGLFVAADTGTLFLDEIGELPLELQTKLLRALQDGE